MTSKDTNESLWTALREPKGDAWVPRPRRTTVEFAAACRALGYTDFNLILAVLMRNVAVERWGDEFEVPAAAEDLGLPTAASADVDPSGRDQAIDNSKEDGSKCSM